MKQRTSQSNEVLKHLQRTREITSIQAIKKFGATRLSSIIFNLRAKGYVIETIMREGKSRYGARCPYAVYKLIKEPDEE